MAAATLARFVILETLRGGLPWLAVACIVVAFSLAAFLSQLALTESLALQTSIVAALLRASAVFLIATQVIASSVRENDDKVLEMMLALPLPRAMHYAGRLAGFALGALLLAIVFSLPLALWVPVSALVSWSVSLALELILVATASLFFAMTLARILPAIAAVAGLYLLGRSITAIQAIASGPLADTTLAGRAAGTAVDAVALLLPRIDLTTRTEWLLYGTAGSTTFWTAQASLIIYIALLAAAGLFDFQRRSL